MKDNSITDTNSLSKAKQAAIMLLSLDEEHLSVILSLLSKDEIRKLSSIIKTLGPYDKQIVPNIVKKISDKVSNQRLLNEGVENNIDEMSYLLEEDKIEKISVGNNGQKLWEKLNKVDPIVLSRHLKNESPQATAVVLSKLNPELSANIISTFSSLYAAEIIDRIFNLKNVKREVLVDIENTLEDEVINNSSNSANFNNAFKIIDSLKKDDENRIIVALDQSYKETADIIHSKMLNFEDLSTIDANGIKYLLHFIEKDKMVIALRGASEKLKNTFFKNMNPRAEKIIRTDLENLGPAKLKDIENAQYDIISVVKDLEKAGKLSVKKLD